MNQFLLGFITGVAAGISAMVLLFAIAMLDTIKKERAEMKKTNYAKQNRLRNQV